MEFKNLDCNILHLLNNHFRRNDRMGPLDMGRIYDAFSDIPKEGVDNGIASLESDDLIVLAGGKKKIRLTADGISRIESFEPCPL